MRAGDTHQRWHPHEDEAYLRAAIARVNGGDMDELRDKIADILTDATDERHNRTVMGDYDPIDEDPYVTRILAAVAEKMTSLTVIQEASSGYWASPNGSMFDGMAAALRAAGITPEDAP